MYLAIAEYLDKQKIYLNNIKSVRGFKKSLNLILRYVSQMFRGYERSYSKP